MSRYILVVEDSQEDYTTISRLIGKTRYNIRLEHCESGDDALALLQERRAETLGGAGLPTLVLLDLNLPGTDGREVLRELRADEALNTIPVVVLTTSADPQDVYGCYRDGANSYLLKPVDLPLFQEALETTLRYWFNFVVLPDEPR